MGLAEVFMVVSLLLPQKDRILRLEVVLIGRLGPAEEVLLSEGDSGDRIV